MQAYDLLFTHQPTIAALAFILCALISYLFSGGKFFFSLFFFNYGPSFSVSFFLHSLFIIGQNAFDLISVIIFELSFLALIAFLFYKIKNGLIYVRHIDWNKICLRLLLLEIFLFAPLLLQSDFGIFATGSRVGYLTSGFLGKYLTYAVVLIASLLAVSIAGILTESGKFNFVSVLAIIVNVFFSFLSGSKGGVFLWLISIIALSNISFFKIFRFRYSVIIFTVGLSFYYTMRNLMDVLGLNFLFLSKLILSRFFLNNDARALALDMRNVLVGSADFFAEAFRSFARVFGYSLNEYPLGVRLYREGLSILNGNGANTGITPLILAYFEEGFALLPVILFLTAGISVVVFCEKMIFKSSNDFTKIFVRTVLVQFLLIFSQDFLAVLAMFPFIVLILGCLKVRTLRKIMFNVQ